MATQNNTSLKTCSKCGVQYPATNEYFARQGLGLRADCKECNRVRAQQWREANPQRSRDSANRYRLVNHEKVKERKRKHYAENRDDILKKGAEYRDKHRDQIRMRDREHYQYVAEQRRAQNRASSRKNAKRVRDYQKSYYAHNRDRLLAYRRKWGSDNRNRVYELNNSRRARELCAEGNYTSKDVLQLLVEQNRYCHYCGISLCDGYHVDHVIPLSRAGTNHPDNLCLACPNCNCSKKDKTPDEWQLVRGW